MLLVHTSNNKVDTLEDLRLNQEGHLNSYWETSSEVELRQWFLLFPFKVYPKQQTPNNLHSVMDKKSRCLCHSEPPFLGKIEQDYGKTPRKKHP